MINNPSLEMREYIENIKKEFPGRTSQIDRLINYATLSVNVCKVSPYPFSADISGYIKST